MLRCDKRVEVYDTVDELSALIVVLYDSLPAVESEIKDILMQIQKYLLKVEAVFACPTKDNSQNCTTKPFSK